jgi:polyhydroxybutyrate depolymerase
MSFLDKIFAGCTGKSHKGSITHDGLDREFILYVPRRYEEGHAVPLLINLHGYTSNAEEQMWYGDFRCIADDENFLIVHPEGTVYDGKTHWNTGGWTPNSTVDDLCFIDALIEYLKQQYKIDPKRIYAAGMSNGGEMSYHLACQLSDKIAAIASVAGSMTPETFGGCAPTHPMPVMHLHGTKDSVVPYEGDKTATPIMKVLEYWANHNQCAIQPVITQIANSNNIDGSTVEHFIWKGPVASVEHFKIIGADHTWPGTSIDLGGTNQDIDASKEIWKFLKQYDLDGPRS